MQLRPSKSLSVIGAMKDIADYKIMRAKADMAPTLAERAKLQFEWEKEDRPTNLKIKDLDIKGKELDIVDKERESLFKYTNDTANLAKWVLEGKTEEEKRKRYDISKRLITEAHEDQVTSDGPDGKPGDLIPEYDEETIQRVASLAAEKAKILDKYKSGERGIDPETGEVIVEAEYKPTSVKEKSWKTEDDEGNVYIVKQNEDGTLNVTKAPGGQIGKKSKVTQGTGAERQRDIRIAKMPEYQALAREDPNKAYEKGIRLEDDGTVFVDAYGAPVILPSHATKLKRGVLKGALAAGEQRDDAFELQELLVKPEVSQTLRKEIDSGLIDRIKGMTFNQLRKWMQGRGISEDSDTGTAIGRMQRMASEERKYFLGAAITETELKTVLGWMLNAGDSYDTMINKLNVIVHEADEQFIRFLDIYKNDVNMSPFYKAFGIDRFSNGQPNENNMDSEVDQLIKKYGSK